MYRYIHIQDRHPDTDRPTSRQTQQGCRHDRQTGRQADRQKGRQADKQTRQSNRQTDKYSGIYTKSKVKRLFSLRTGCKPASSALNESILRMRHMNFNRKHCFKKLLTYFNLFYDASPCKRKYQSNRNKGASGSARPCQLMLRDNLLYI